MSDYGKIPAKAQATPKPYKAELPQEKIHEMNQLIKLARVGPAVYENQQKDRRYGLGRDWLVDAKRQWETSFGWRKSEERINSFPNFTLPIKDDDGFEFEIHFVALFSERPDAVPIVFYHGWPGSFLEFLPMLSVIKGQYSPQDLPYHIVVPSLPGYAFSSGPPVDRDFTAQDVPRIMNKLMCALGFDDGYISQGGDLGSQVARSSARLYDSCKAFHVNMNIMMPPDNADDLPMDEAEKRALPRGQEFKATGSAYAQEHGTRTATIGLVLSSSPLALLGWVGEKFLEWTDDEPEVDMILESVSLYWLTDTYPRCIYPYREVHGGQKDPETMKPKSSEIYCSKPMGFSWFPKEIQPMPRSWVAESGNLVFYRQHTSGGHFAALERPAELWQDVRDFVDVAWHGKEMAQS